MADQYKGLELKLSQNPHVIQADAYSITIRMDSIREFYDAFQKDRSSAQCCEALRKAGFPIDEEGCVLGENLAGWFDRHGCPDQDVKVLYRKVTLNGEDGTVMDNEGLIGTGIFMPRFNGLGLTDAWRGKVLLYYPEMPILDALALAGINPAILGEERIGKVRRNLDLTLSRIRASREKARRKEEQEEHKAEEPEMPVGKADPDRDIPVGKTEPGPCGHGCQGAMTPGQLMETGLFVKTTSGIGPSREFEKMLLDAYPAQSIEESLEKVGLSVAAVGKERVARLKERVRRKKEQPTQKTGDIGQVCCGENLSARLSDDELLKTGKFIRNHTGLSLIPDLERLLYVNYPDQNIEEGLKKAGIDPADMGRARVYRLKARFESLKGRDPLLYTDKRCTEYSEETILFYSSHPYIDSCSGRMAALSSRFFEEAHFLAGQPVMRLLRIFCIDPGLFTYEEREEIRKTVEGYVEAQIREPSFEEVMDCPPVLRQAYYNRMSALEEEIDHSLEGIAAGFPEMSMDQKRGLLLAIKDFARDPGGRFTTEYILGKIGVARSTYYGIVSNEAYGRAVDEKNAKDDEDVALIVQVMEYKGFRKGSWQIYMMMDDIVHVRFGLNKIRRLMRKYGLHSGIREPNLDKRRMKDYLKGQVKENTLDRKFRLYRPCQVLLTDVTYLTYGPDRARAYCSAMIDPVTSKLVALNISENNDLDLAKETLRLCAEDPRVVGCLLHSDRGCLYLSSEFQKEAARIGLTQSMSKLGCCWDNSPAESFNGNVKQEVCYESCQSFEELRDLIESYRDYYNNERHVKSRKRMTPVQYERYLLSLSDDEWARYIAERKAEYDDMKERSRKKAAEYERSHGEEISGEEDKAVDR